jgi:DNA repair protein RecO (recombination protein O)
MYTPHLGKIQGIAKSVRKTTSRMAGHLELLTYSQVTLARGKNIDTVIGSQTINAFMPVKSNLDLISCGLYMLEMVGQFTSEETADPNLFELLLNSLEKLCRGADQKALLRYFELRLLRHAGYHPELAHCVACRRPMDEAQEILFSPGAGGLICPACDQMRQNHSYRVSPSALRLLRLFQTGDWQDISQVAADEIFMREVENLMQNYIRYLLEKDVKSAAWLADLQQQTPGY